MSYQVIDKGQLGPPVIGKAAQMWNDKRHLRVLRGQQLHYGNLPYHIIEHRQCKRLGHLTHLACDAPVMPVYLDTTKAVVPDGLLDDIADVAAVSYGMHQCKAIKALGMAGHEACYLAVGDAVVRVKHTQQHRAVDTSCGGSA